MRISDLKLFFNYVISTMVGTLIWGSYSIVDAVFIGNSAGSVSLTALNLSYPIAMVKGYGFLKETVYLINKNNIRIAGWNYYTKDLFINSLKKLKNI